MAEASASQVVVDGHSIRVTNLDKVLYPATGTTKGEVLGYYQQVAPLLVPLARRRPATRKRWPNGVGPGGDGAFFEKNLQAKSTPDWVVTYEWQHDDGPKNYPLVDDAATLVWLAQLASLEIHVPQWRVDEHLQRQNPDRLVLDLDPGPGVAVEQLVELAHMLREILDGVGLTSVPVTSGSKGIHLYACLDEHMTTDEASALARELAKSLEGLRPDLVVSDMKKELRAGKILLDWSQNNGNKTTISPYSLRGRDHPTVATPRTWDEIEPGLHQLEFTEVLERLTKRGDPMAEILGGEAPTAPSRPLVALTSETDDERPAPQASDAGDASDDAIDTAQPDLPVIEPMLATPGTEEGLHGRGWHYEVKWDGYRAVASVSGGRASFRSRGGLDLTARYLELAELGTKLKGHAAVLDGEVVVLDESGRSSFELLQNHGGAEAKAHYMAFDLMHLDGRSLVREPWTVRRQALEELFGDDGVHVHVPDTLGRNREVAFGVSRDLGLEGVVAKVDDSTYQPGRRGSTWIKVKHVHTQEVVVVGWSPGQGGRADTVGSVLLAVNDESGLRYAGRAGSGFTAAQLDEALALLKEIETDAPAVTDVPRVEAKGAHWVEPLLVGEVSFTEWTSTHRLRHPVWRGWRPDKHSEDVVREG